MDIGILGLPKSGKTTLFNALTGMQASVSAYGSASVDPNVAVVKVPDPRVDRLTEMFESKKTVHPVIKYVDLAGVAAESVEQTHGLPEAHLRHLGLTDALLAVIRAFPDDSGRAPDPAADLAAIELELLLSDMQKVENRLPRLEKSLTIAKVVDRERLLSEQSALKKIKERFDQEQPIRGLEFDAEENKSIRGFQFLSEKPLLVVFNVAEADLQSGTDWTARFADRWVPGQCMGIQVCATVEMDIAHLAAQEREAFLADYGITHPAAERIVQLSYELLGLISFLTSGPDESRAWTIRRGALAPQAAGVIHSDIERGFIRAETISYNDLMDAGSMAEARKRGLLRLEGKNYEVRDGDVVVFRFSV
jgi:ribosome-binding ATPase